MPSLHEQARLVAAEAARDPALVDVREQSGDIFAGALAADATTEQAHNAAMLAVTTPELVAQVPSSGGLMVGALAHISNRGQIPE